MRRRRWVWVGGAVLLVVLLCAAAVMFPTTPYRFLRAGGLQWVSIDAHHATGHASSAGFTEWTRQCYVIEDLPSKVNEQIRKELRSENGWSEVAGGADQTYFSRGDVTILVSGTYDGSYYPKKNTKTEVMVVKPTTFPDRIREKVRPFRPRIVHEL